MDFLRTTSIAMYYSSADIHVRVTEYYGGRGIFLRGDADREPHSSYGMCAWGKVVQLTCRCIALLLYIDYVVK